MKLYFKPMPWLTVIVAICLAILISLGTWQYHRLQWKTGLLAEVEAAVTAPPLKSWRELNLVALKKQEPVDFRRIELDGRISAAEPYLVYASRSDGIYWRAFTPVTKGKESVFAAFGFVKGEDKGENDVSALPIDGTRFAGYLRKGYPMGTIEALVKNKANPDANRYFKFNQTGDWSSEGFAASHYNAMPLYIDVVEGITDANELPIKRPDIRNNHLDYMLTWYSFAVILLIIYFILHRRAGRLKFS